MTVFTETDQRRRSELGKATEATSLAEEVLRARLELLGSDHPHTRQAEHLLAGITTEA